MIKVFRVLFLLSVFIIPQYLFAAVITPSETFDPTCTPGAVDCYVLFPDEFLDFADTPSAYTVGSLLFTSAAGVTEDNTNLFWDDTNDRLGIQNMTPAYELDVDGRTQSFSVVTGGVRYPGNSITGVSGHNNYTDISGQIGMDGLVVLDDSRNLTGLSSVQAGEIESATFGGFTLNGQFAAGGGYTVGQLTENTEVADLNNDGHKDLVVVDYSNSELEVYMGVGDATFSAAVAYSAPDASFTEYDVELSDVDLDGWVDIVVLSTFPGTGQLKVFYNNGDGTFDTSDAPFATAFAIPFRITVADFDNDSFEDILVADANFPNQGFALYKNNRDRTFTYVDTYAGNNYPYDMAAGDFNGDGYLDFTAALNGHGMYIYLNNGDGTFAPFVDYDGIGVDVWSVDIGDFDHDGDTDIMAASNHDPDLWIFLNNGDGSFAAVAEYTGAGCGACFNAKGHYVHAVDVNKDGYLDSVYEVGTIGSGDDEFYVFLNDQDGTFTFYDEYAIAGGDPGSSAVGDFNEDGIVDVLIGVPGSTEIQVWTGIKEIVFTSNTSTGNFGIGLSTPTEKLDVATTTAGVVAQFNDTTATCTIDPSSTGTEFACSSDRTLKDNIKTIDSTLERVLQLNPVNYTWIADETNKQQTGFIAQEVQEIFPSLVTQHNNGMLAVGYIGMVPYLTKAVQDVADSIDSNGSKVRNARDTIQGFLFEAKSVFFGGQVEIEDVITNSVHVEELCIKETCVDEEDLLRAQGLEIEELGSPEKEEIVNIEDALRAL